MSELKIMSHLGQHENIVNLLGACTHGGEGSWQASGPMATPPHLPISPSSGRIPIYLSIPQIPTPGAWMGQKLFMNDR